LFLLSFEKRRKHVQISMMNANLVQVASPLAPSVVIWARLLACNVALLDEMCSLTSDKGNAQREEKMLRGNPPAD
jgi:hypothetical protein